MPTPPWTFSMILSRPGRSTSFVPGPSPPPPSASPDMWLTWMAPPHERNASLRQKMLSELRTSSELRSEYTSIRVRSLCYSRVVMRLPTPEHGAGGSTAAGGGRQGWRGPSPRIAIRGLWPGVSGAKIHISAQGRRAGRSPRGCRRFTGFFFMNTRHPLHPCGAVLVTRLRAQMRPPPPAEFAEK